MRSDAPRSTVLGSAGFLAALAALGINDWFLKDTFHNALTGKISDFAGLFAVTALLANLFPRRRTLVAFGIASGFVFWKLRLSDPIFSLAIKWGGFSMGRVVDPTDLLALMVVPLAAAYRPRPAFRPTAVMRAFALVAACLLFAGTSQVQHHIDLTTDPAASRRYPSPLSAQAVIDALEKCHASPYASQRRSNGVEGSEVLFHLDLDGKVNLTSVTALAVLEATPSGTDLVISSVSVPGTSSPYTDEEVRQAFSEQLEKCLSGRSTR
jgi:hypothetical protein